MKRPGTRRFTSLGWAAGSKAPDSMSSWTCSGVPFSMQALIFAEAASVSTMSASAFFPKMDITMPATRSAHPPKADKAFSLFNEDVSQ